MADLQMDIFGNEVPTEQAYAAKPKETLKSRYRKMYGYDHNHHCGDCQYMCIFNHGNEKYFKCNLMGISDSEATDISKSDPACSRYKPC